MPGMKVDVRKRFLLEYIVKYNYKCANKITKYFLFLIFWDCIAAFFTAVIISDMAKDNPGKNSQVDIHEYLKTKEQRAKRKMKLHYPLFVKILAAVPVAYVLFLIIYFIVRLRFVPEH
jgi:hypothetical protein